MSKKIVAQNVLILKHLKNSEKFNCKFFQNADWKLETFNVINAIYVIMFGIITLLI
jgi:hypothetical protein